MASGSDMDNPVILHTDGSCLNNPGPGGWAAILQWRGEVRELSGGVEGTTNNRMELQAAIEGLERADTADAGRTAYRQQICDAGCDRLDAPLESQWLANGEQEAGAESGFVEGA